LQGALVPTKPVAVAVGPVRVLAAVHDAVAPLKGAHE
jgi:hypothetical protein